MALGWPDHLKKATMVGFGNPQSRAEPPPIWVYHCNTDRSGEFQMASSESRRFPLACTAENSDEVIRQLVLDLEYCSIEEQRQAVMEIKLLAKYDWAILFTETWPTHYPNSQQR
jgi:hypothetical protein